MDKLELIQFQLDFSTVDVERGSRLEPRATSITMIFSPLPLPEILYVPVSEEARPVQGELEEGYRAMAAENSLLAEVSLPIALEAWPTWEA